VAAIDRAGGSVRYDWQYRDGHSVTNAKPWWPRWLLDHLGVDYFYDVRLVFFPRQGSDAEMAHLGHLTRVDTLVLDPSSVSAPGLTYLERLTNLRWLTTSSSVGSTDTRIMPLKALAPLRGLNIDGTDVTDTGLAYLVGHAGLELLGLEDTAITDAGLAHVGKLKALKLLDLDGTRVGDEGLAHLKALASLTHLHLKGTKVTDAGVRDLQKALPNLGIIR
jgi:hypothetical protein